MTETPTERLTPQQMADWLATFSGQQWERDLLVPGELRTLDVIAAYLSRQPTDAQKIEALKLAADAADGGADVSMDGIWSSPETRGAIAVQCARLAHDAMRLLGLNPEGV